MTRSSPFRRSQSLASTEHSYGPGFLSESRNSEGDHLDALLAAQKEHTRVRETAMRVYELQQLEDQRRQVQEAEIAERKRIEAERALAEEERRLQQLRATTIPKPPPAPPKPAQAPSPAPAPAPAPAVERPPPQPKPAAPAASLFSPPASSPQPSAPAEPAKPPPAAPPAAVQNKPPQLPNGAAAAPRQNVSAMLSNSGLSELQKQINDRYLHIHQELKAIRKATEAEAKMPGSPMKAEIGKMRREISKCVGQLTSVGGAKGNKPQVSPLPPSPVLVPYLLPLLQFF